MIFSLSWKNIWRNKVRSLVVIIAVSLGLFGGTFSNGLMNGMTTRRVNSAIENEVSHIQIHSPEFLENPEIGYAIDNSDELINEIEKNSDVIAVSKRMKINSMARTSAAATGVVIIGIYPEKEKEVTGLYNKICDSTNMFLTDVKPSHEEVQKFVRDSCGTYFENARKNTIVIGRKLAKKLKVKVRSKIVLTFQTIDGSLSGAAFRIGGIFKTSNSLFDETTVFVNKGDLISLTGFDVNKAHEIAIKLNPEADASVIAKDLQSKYPELAIRDWKEVQPDLGLMTEMMGMMMYLIIVIILLALAFAIVNTMLMVVLERTKEIGMLMAIGMGKLRVFKMIMFETVMLSITGGIIGMFISWGAIELFKDKGINLSSYAEGFEAYGIESVLYPELGIDVYIGTTILVIIAGIIASLYPAVKALKLNPSNALRTE
ncbi:ABC transporter permease [Bacteroidota bacterium]